METSGATTAIRDLGEIDIGPLDHSPTNGTSPPKPPRRRRRYLIGGAAAALLITLMAIGANLALSSTYSSVSALNDYLRAQSKGDVSSMWANGLYQGGEASYHVFFTRDALAAMMKDPANRISNFKILSVRHLDSNTDSIATELTWNGSREAPDFRVVKDTTRMHAFFYPSWRVVPASSTIELTYPNQGGAITIDGIEVPSSAGSQIPVIAGVHQLVMGETPIVQQVSQTVDATFASPQVSITLEDKLSPAALDAARQAVKDAMASCDAKKYMDCPGHTYYAPNDGVRYFLALPSGNVPYSRYTVTLVGDPTSDMKTSFDATDGQLSVSGTCTTNLATDRGQVVPNTGTFDGKLAWNGTKFDPDILWTC